MVKRKKVIFLLIMGTVLFARGGGVGCKSERMLRGAVTKVTRKETAGDIRAIVSKTKRIFKVGP